MADQARIEQITNEVFALDTPRIDPVRKGQISGFISATINGDADIHAHLVINAGLGENRMGVLVYVLTNVRLIKIEIDDKNVQASSPSLSSIITVDRKLLDGERTSIAITFPNNSVFGLTYPSATQAITDFFQTVDMARTRGAAN